MPGGNSGMRGAGFPRGEIASIGGMGAPGGMVVPRSGGEERRGERAAKGGMGAPGGKAVVPREVPLGERAAKGGTGAPIGSVLPRGGAEGPLATLEPEADALPLVGAAAGTFSLAGASGATPGLPSGPLGGTILGGAAAAAGSAMSGALDEDALKSVAMDFFTSSSLAGMRPGAAAEGTTPPSAGAGGFEWMGGLVAGDMSALVSDGVDGSATGVGGSDAGGVAGLVVGNLVVGGGSGALGSGCCAAVPTASAGLRVDGANVLLAQDAFTGDGAAGWAAALAELGAETKGTKV